ncbi:MAG: MCP four helix bundle domain-containing protein [Deltaproteobacteria bacterium]|nr:MCP four helix bundle domain-containing protein [Deltaproteobacteria bacterium]
MAMGLKVKMLLSYIFICVMLVFIGLLGSYSIKKVEIDYQVILDVNLKKMALLGSLLSHAKDSSLPALALGSATSKNQAEELKGEFESKTVKFGETKKLYDALPLAENESDIKKNFESKWTKYHDLVEKSFEMAKKANLTARNEELATFITDEVDSSRIELDEALGKLSVFQQKMADQLAVASEASAEKMIKTSFFSVGIVFLISLVFGVVFSRRIATALSRIQESLKHEAESIKVSSAQVSENIVSLEGKLGHQASAVQETMVACSEVTAMVEKTSEAAGISSKKTTESQDFVTQGTKSIIDLSNSIDKIVQSFSSIKSEVAESHKGVQEVSSLINEIKTKTSVINEIVFQTKLLSFNASVEAARAGEQGKGFAVVAEEVGGLAKMSGDAAAEINTLIDRSAVRIVQIFNDMQTRIGTQLDSGEDRIQEGKEKADTCEEVFKSIQNIMGQIQTQVGSVSQAASEQSTGVGEINKAVALIETTAQENSSLAKQISETTLVFDQTVVELVDVVSDLTSLLTGAGSVSNDNRHSNNESRREEAHNSKPMARAS